MFNMGMGELVIILIVALLVLGPKRIPEVATGLGKAIREFRKATRDLQQDLAIDESVHQPLQELRSALRDEPMVRAPSPAVSMAPAHAVPASNTTPMAAIASTSGPATAPTSEPAAIPPVTAVAHAAAEPAPASPASPLVAAAADPAAVKS